MSGMGKWVLAAGVVIAGVLTIALVGVAFASYNCYLTAVGNGSPRSDTARVSIGQPAQGASITTGEVVSVAALATGPHSFSGMELWVDGELLGFDESTSGGESPLAADFFWRPTVQGAHSLVARAVVDEDTSFTSAVVSLQVTADNAFERGAEGSELQDALHPADVEGASQSIAGPSSGASIGSASDWGGSLGDWAQSLLPSSPPQAPELGAAADGCSAELMIHDLSENESGLRLYRQGAAAQNWELVATLAGQSQSAWIETSDLAGAGPFNY